MKTVKTPISFPMENASYKRDTTNGYFNPTSITVNIMNKKNATNAATKMRMGKDGSQAKQVSTKANEPVQSEAFKKGYCNH
jgi:hypothetical protein